MTSTSTFQPGDRVVVSLPDLQPLSGVVIPSPYPVQDDTGFVWVDLDDPASGFARFAEQFVRPLERESVTVSLPIPPAILSKNGRPDHWSDRHKAFQRYALVASNKLREAMGWQAWRWDGPVSLRIRWVAARRQFPDDDNAIGRCAAYRDGAQLAGLVVNDQQIRTAGVEFDVDKGNPRVELTFTREAVADAAK